MGGTGFPDEDPTWARGPARALFELPRDGQPPPSGFYGLPFPNDIRADDEGAIDMADYPRRTVLIDLYVSAIAEQVRGFSVVAASHFRFDNLIDPRSLPADPWASLADDASVYLVCVDRDSPRHGERIPLEFRFEEFDGETIGKHWLAVLPYPGFVLAERTTYAVVVTDRVLASDASPVAPSADFTAVLSGEPSADPAVTRAQSIYRPLVDWLDEPGGDERDDLVSAAVFTTGDATSLVGDMRRAIYDQLPVPRARRITRQPDHPLYYWFDGNYDTPNFQRGEPPYWDLEDGGNIVRDPGTGMPIIHALDEVRFSVTVPRGDMPAYGWPVVVFAHGTGGDYHSFERNGVARYLAEQGLAVISTDQVMHEPRIPRGASPEFLFFNFQNPLAARDNTLQGSADLFQMVRLVRDLEIDERKPGGIRGVRFDRDRVYFFGHSQGGLTGPPFLAHEPLVHGAVLSGAGGLLYLSMTLKTEPIDIASLAAALIRDYPLDEFNPVLALLQMYTDRADPVVYGPHLVRQPFPGVPAKHIYQSEGFTDRFTPVPSIEALATSIGADIVDPVVAEFDGLSLTQRQVLQTPVIGNQGVTSILAQYPERFGSDGHFVVFDTREGRLQSTRFLGSLARHGVAVMLAP